MNDKEIAMDELFTSMGNFENSSITGKEILDDLSRLVGSLPRPQPWTAAIMPEAVIRELRADVCKMPIHSSITYTKMFGSIPVYPSKMTRRRQIRFPRSKRRRIQKKWRRKSANWIEEQDPTIYMMNAVTMGV